MNLMNILIRHYLRIKLIFIYISSVFVNCDENYFWKWRARPNYLFNNTDEWTSNAQEIVMHTVYHTYTHARMHTVYAKREQSSLSGRFSRFATPLRIDKIFASKNLTECILPMGYIISYATSYVCLVVAHAPRHCSGQQFVEPASYWMPSKSHCCHNQFILLKSKSKPLPLYDRISLLIPSMTFLLMCRYTWDYA